MAKAGAPDAVDRQLHGRGPPADKRLIRAAEASRDPRVDGSEPIGRVARERLAVAVPADEEHLGAERAHAGETLGRPRAPEDIAADDGVGELLARDLDEDRVERRQVAVDVVEAGDPHWIEPSSETRRSPRAEPQSTGAAPGPTWQ